MKPQIENIKEKMLMLKILNDIYIIDWILLVNIYFF